jgi:hypothetical protein
MARGAVGNSFLAILVISLSALIAHNKLANVDYRVGVLLGVGGIVAHKSALGSSSTSQPPVSRGSSPPFWWAWQGTSSSRNEVDCGWGQTSGNILKIGTCSVCWSMIHERR